MSTVSAARLRELLYPYFPAIADRSRQELVDQLCIYLDLLIKWNGRMNLSAVREPEQIVQRHFSESLFAALHLPPCRTLLDLGSGAGFPGLPIALACPAIAVTLAESQNKKAAFLRETVRVLGVTTEVWAYRAEKMPPDRLFDAVTMRAVDRPFEALALGRKLLAAGGYLVHLSSGDAAGGSTSKSFSAPSFEAAIAVPGSEKLVLKIMR